MVATVSSREASYSKGSSRPLRGSIAPSGDACAARKASTARRRRRSPRAAATVTALKRPIATTPSIGTWKGRRPGTTAPGEGDGLGDCPASEPEGDPLGSVIVVPNGVGETLCVVELPGMGVAVAGTDVGRGVGRAVAPGPGVAVGGGVGAGVGDGVGGGVGAVTTT